MAISTSNESYSVARNQVDELLYRSFHGQNHFTSSSSSDTERNIGSGTNRAPSSSSSASSRSSNDFDSSHHHHQHHQHQHQQMRFISPALCSTSATFFHSDSPPSVSPPFTNNNNTNINTNNNSNHDDSQSSPSQEGIQILQRSLQAHLQGIEQDYNLQGIGQHHSMRGMLGSNSHSLNNRRNRYPTTSKLQITNVDQDPAETVLLLTSIVFEEKHGNNDNIALGGQEHQQQQQQQQQQKQQNRTHLQTAQDLFKNYGSTIPKKVCQHPFKRNDIVWVCRTCQADETCVLCHTCYDNSHHEGHDVAFYHAQAGGCCDCGDPQAWDSEGFCPMHGKEINVELELEMQERVKGVVDGCVEFLIKVVNGVDKGYRRANGNGNGHAVGGMDVYGERGGGKRKFQLGRSQSAVIDIDVGGDAASRAHRSFQRYNTYAGGDLEPGVGDRASSGDGGGMQHEGGLSLESMHVSNHTEQDEGDNDDHMSGPSIAIQEEHSGDEEGMQDGSMQDECQFNPNAASTSKSRIIGSSSYHSSDFIDEEIERQGLEFDGDCKTVAKSEGETFNPEAASTSKSQSCAAKKRINPENMTPAQYLGLLGSQEDGIFLLLHADEVHKSIDVTNALRKLYTSHPYHGNFSNLDGISNKIAHLLVEETGDLIVWGTEELMQELGPVLSVCWKDGDELACTRFGALILEKAKILSGCGMVVSIKTRWELCREVRCAAILEFLNLMSSSCDPLCLLVSVGLGAMEDTDNAERGDGDTTMNEESQTSPMGHSNELSIMLQNDLKLPRKIGKLWHDLLLTLLAVPNFKAALANAYVDTYAAVTSEFAHGIGIFDKSSYTLSVQFLNRVTYVEDLVKERDLLGCLVRSLFRTMSVASKKNAGLMNDSSTQRCSSTSPSWTINMIHHAIDDFINPLGARSPSQWRSLFARDEGREEQYDSNNITATRLNTTLDPLHHILFHRRYSPCVSDLKCVLNVPGVSRLFSALPNTKFEEDSQASPYNKPCILDAWVNLLSICQNMDRQRWRREEEGHIEQEPRDWVGAFNADIAIGSLFERLLAWEDGDALLKNSLFCGFKKSNTFLSAAELTHYILLKGVHLWQCSEALSFIATAKGPTPEFDCPVCLPMSTTAANYGAPVAMTALPVSQCQLWSFHLPLHRFVASCLRELTRRPYTNDSGQNRGVHELIETMKQQEDAKNLFKVYSGLLEFPTVVLARNSQIRSDLWLRNGRGMFDMVLNYSEPHFCKALRDADLALVQFAFVGLSSLRQCDLDACTKDEKHKVQSFSCAKLVNLFLHRFGIFDYTGFIKAPHQYEDRYFDDVDKGYYPAEKETVGKNKDLPWTYSATDDPERHKSMLEEFLYTMIILVTELFAPPPVNAEGAARQAKSRLRREIVHRLASGPKAHSELAEVNHVLPLRDNMVLAEEGKLVNPDDAAGAALEAALVEVADCKSFKGKSDKWELQRWAWNEYDPAFFHLSLRHHQNASEARPNSLDSKDRSITPMPYAPFPPPAHRTFIRLRRDITSDSSIVAIIYRALHIHCRDVVGEDNTFAKNAEKLLSESYGIHAMSETILGRVIHLLTLGTYAWESLAVEDPNYWKDGGGGDAGSVFHKFTSAPTHEDWVKRILLAKPEEIMGSQLYSNEKNALQLLNALATVGGSDQFKVQDRSIRCGAAWLCEYAARHSSTAAKILGDREKASDAVNVENSLVTDKQRRRKEAKARVMKRMQVQMAKFASSMQSTDDTDNGNQDIIGTTADSESPASPQVSSSMLIDTNNNSIRTTPKTTETAIEYAQKATGSGPGLPTLNKEIDSPQHRSSVFIPRLLRERPKCIICGDDGTVHHEAEQSDLKDDSIKPKKKILTWCGFIQASTVARGGGGVPPEQGYHINHLVGTHISLCGHAIHSSCCESHLKDAEGNYERHDKRGDFKCPLCRRLSNCLVPFIDVSESWALPAKPSEPNTCKTSTRLLHDFLDQSRWWAARNDNSLVWNGRCSFIPRQLWNSTSNAQARVTAFGKKDLCKAWSTVMWTPPNIPREDPSQAYYMRSLTSTAVTVVWRRILDQISETSYKADSKRIGEENLQHNLGEFRHYLVEKVAYNRGNLLANTIDPTEWPACMLPSPSHEKRQAFSREKLLSKILLSIQGLTYTFCTESLECTRLAQKSTATKLDSICAKFGVDRFACNGKFIIMPLPSSDDISQLFHGKIGRLRYYALAISMATGPVAKEVVHLCMDFPTTKKNDPPTINEESNLKRSVLAAPILCGHVLTHTIAAICASCAQDRLLSEAIGNAQYFTSTLIPTLGKLPEGAAVDDSVNFIQLGYIARILQTLLGVFHQELSGDWNSRESQISMIVDELDSNKTMSDWQRGCHLLLRTALSECSVHPQLWEDFKEQIGVDEEGSLLIFWNACEKAREHSSGFICYAGAILQLILPKSITIFQEMAGPKKESEGEIDSLLSLLCIESLETMIDSPLTSEIIRHWYGNARSKKLVGIEKDIDTNRSYRVNDWPHLQCTKPALQSLNLPKGRLPLLRGVIVNEEESIVENSVNKIHSLPISYTDLYATLGCMLPDSELTAICFVCGQVLDAGGKGECTRHTLTCGAGCGIFFLLQECVCIAIHKGTAAYTTSPYVDSHGETPQYRGRPLNMDESRYEYLHELWSGHMLREHVISEKSKSTRNLMVSANFY